MRVSTITIYKQATYQLNRLTSSISQANAVVSTNCRINCASDDPSGMAQVLDITSNISCLNQYQANIDQGQTLLTAAETALDAMADQMLELNLLCSQLANASASAQERTDAAGSMQVYLDQLIDLTNTKAYGGYVFAGDQNQVAPFSYDDPDNSTGVTYAGSDDPTCVKTGKNSILSIECCGCDLFYEDKIIVDDSNHSLVFQENPGTGTENILTIEAIVPDGTYTREALAQIIETTMTQASLDKGYGVGYGVTYDGSDNAFSIGTDKTADPQMMTTLITVQTDTVRISGMGVSSGELPDMEIEVINPSTLNEYTPEPEGTAPLTLTYSEANSSWTVENDPGYGLPSEIEGDGQTLALDLDDNGTADIVLNFNATPEDGTTVFFDIVEGFENNSILQDLGFESDTVTIEPVQSRFAVAEAFTVTGANNTIDFIETLTGEADGSTQLTARIEPGTYPDPESYARAVEKALETASAKNGSRVNYEVIYNADNQGFTIQEDRATGRQLASFDLLFSSGTNSGSSAATDLGFYTQDLHSGPVTGEAATWSIFDTLFDLETSLAANDVDGIQRAMIRLENHYESLTSSMASVGTAYASLSVTAATASDTETTLTTQLSDVQDADTVAAIMTLNSAETVYEAALSSCSTIMGLSLVDYM